VHDPPWRAILRSDAGAVTFDECQPLTLSRGAGADEHEVALDPPWASPSPGGV